MNINDCKRAVDKLIGAKKKVQRQREEWSTRSEIIKAALTQVATTHSELEAFVEIDQTTKGAESIWLIQKNGQSGIYQEKTDAQDFRSYVKHGGSISFQQTVTGLVAVVMEYPHIEEFVAKKEPLILGSYEPFQITTEVVLDRVSEWIDYLADWELQQN